MQDHEFDLYVAKKLQAKKRDADQRGIEFKLTFQSMKNLLKAKHCFYTGIELTTPNSAVQIASDHTIDRVDGSKGYVPGNVVACCYAFNQLKRQVEGGGIVAAKITAKGFSKMVKKMEGNK